AARTVIDWLLQRTVTTLPEAAWFAEGLPEYATLLLLHELGYMSADEMYLAMRTLYATGIHYTGPGWPSLVLAGVTSPRSHASQRVLEFRAPLVAFLLDVELREASAGAASIMDMWREAAEEQRRNPSAVFHTARLLSSVAEFGDLSAFAEQYLCGSRIPPADFDGVYRRWLAFQGRRETRRLHLTTVEVPVRDLPEELDGFEIIHLSDLHLTGYGPYEQDLLRALRPLPARVVAITGDFLGGPIGAQALIPMLMEIGRDRVVFGVFGNHDYRPPVNTEALARDLARAGVRLLVNDAAVVTERGRRLHFVGVDDPHTGRADVERALAAVPPPQGHEREPVILLAHSPDVFPDAEGAGADLILAGHTHGGQICLPGGFP